MFGVFWVQEDLEATKLAAVQMEEGLNKDLFMARQQVAEAALQLKKLTTQLEASQQEGTKAAAQVGHTVLLVLWRCCVCCSVIPLCTIVAECALAKGFSNAGFRRWCLWLSVCGDWHYAIQTGFLAFCKDVGGRIFI
jgi:hypothetical protein